MEPHFSINRGRLYYTPQGETGIIHSAMPLTRLGPVLVLGIHQTRPLRDY
jgi:hypothetical protein